MSAIEPLTKERAERFERLFNDWASSDVQMKLSAGLFPDGTQHIFVAFLLAQRREIIASVKAGAR